MAQELSLLALIRFVASMSTGATGRQVGNLVSWVSVNSKSSQLTEISSNLTLVASYLSLEPLYFTYVWNTSNFIYSIYSVYSDQSSLSLRGTLLANVQHITLYTT